MEMPVSGTGQKVMLLISMKHHNSPLSQIHDKHSHLKEEKN